MAAFLSGKYRGTIVTTDMAPNTTPATVPVSGVDIVRLLSLYLTASADVSPGWKSRAG
jgi:hypothetical protein